MKKGSKFRILFYALGVFTLLAGVWGFVLRFTVGEKGANYGSYVPWGLWVAMYLFFVGIAAGGYMVASLEYLFGIKLFRGTGKVALWGALVTLPIGLLNIAMDLGHIERIWKVYLNPSFGSIMTLMVWGYSLFFIIILVSMWVVIRKPQAKLSKPLFIVGVLLSILLSGGVGALLGVNASRVYWHMSLLPAQFPFFSLASGAALMLLILGWFAPGDDENRNKQIRAFGLIVIAMSFIKLIFLLTDFLLSLYGGVPDSVQAANIVLFGDLWWLFWFIQIGLGTVLPIIVLWLPTIGRKRYLAGAMGLLVLIGIAVARAYIVIPGLLVPEFQGLSAAFQGPQLSNHYLPSLMEWLVVSGGVGIAILAFLLGAERLPLWLSKSTQTPETEVEQ